MVDSVISRKEIPPKINENIDPKKGAMEGDLYQAQRTRSGHSIIYSDVPNKELIMWQHRAGQFIAFRENGSIQIRANRGMHTFVLGENHQYISGLNTETTEGDKATRVSGDCYATNEKNHVSVTRGDSVISSKNEAKTVSEQCDLVCGSQTSKIKNALNIQVTHGDMHIASAKGAAFGSKEESASISAKKAVSLEAGKNIAMSAGESLNFKIGNMEIRIDSSGVWINANKAITAEQAYESTPSPMGDTEGYSPNQIPIIPADESTPMS